MPRPPIGPPPGRLAPASAGEAQARRPAIGANVRPAPASWQPWHNTGATPGAAGRRRRSNREIGAPASASAGEDSETPPEGPAEAAAAGPASAPAAGLGGDAGGVDYSAARGIGGGDLLRIRLYFDEVADADGYLDWEQFPCFMQQLAMESWGIPSWSATVRARVEAVVDAAAGPGRFEEAGITWNVLEAAVEEARRRVARAPAPAGGLPLSSRGLASLARKQTGPVDVQVVTLPPPATHRQTFRMSSETQMADLHAFCATQHLVPVSFIMVTVRERQTAPMEEAARRAPSPDEPAPKRSRFEPAGDGGPVQPRGNGAVF